MENNQHGEPIVTFMPFSFILHIYSEGSWTPSDFGQNEERFLNEQIRKSEYKFVMISPLNSELPMPNSNRQGKWRLIRYQNGKFVEHQDKQDKANHIGTEILILPKCKSPHEKGELVIYNPKKKSQNIRIAAQEFVYVYVFIPLGFVHQVTEVEGVRTVATRPVIDAKKNAKYKQYIKSTQKEARQSAKQPIQGPYKNIRFD